MKNFEVHELLDGWTGQAATLEDAIQLRDSIIRDYGAENVELKITAEVDESDLTDYPPIIAHGMTSDGLYDCDMADEGDG